MEPMAREEGTSVVAFMTDFFDRFRHSLLEGGCLSVHRVTISFDLVEGEIRLTSDSGHSESDVVYRWLSEEQGRAVVTEGEALAEVRGVVEELATKDYFELEPFAMDFTLDYQSGGAKKNKLLYSHTDNIWDDVRHDKLLPGMETELDAFMSHLLKV